MSYPIVRRLPMLTLDGPMQMALDDALLTSAAQGQASLRFYQWAQPTLSLGYFQHAADRLTDPNLAGVDFVRRPSGGGAILHHHELTYALALPAGTDWQPLRQSWACRFHGILIEALASFHVHARAVACGEDRKLGPFLCFEHQTVGDLLIGPSKVVGSAQRRLHGATMQHGSILLESSVHTPNLPGIRELSGVSLPPELLAAAIENHLIQNTGWTLESGAFSSHEYQHADEQIRLRFKNDAWNNKR